MIQRVDETHESDASSVLSSPPSSPCPSVTSPASPIKDNTDVPDLDINHPTGEPSKPTTGSKARSKKNRKRKREKEKAEKGAEGYSVPPALKKKHLNNSKSQSVNFDLGSIRVADNGFTGHHRNHGSQKEYTLDEMVGPESRFKFNLIEWDGRETMRLIDAQNRVIVMCIGCPEDRKWGNVSQRLAVRVGQARQRTKIRKRNRRGRFKALQAGVSYGMGMKKPAVLGQASRTNKDVMAELLEDGDMIRIAGAQSSAFETWSPDLYTSYAQNKCSLVEHDPSLHWNFPNSIFAAITINLGPRTVSIDHTDYNNRCDGFCGITPLAPATKGFDYRRGGHLILWDLKIVIEFPPGTTILVPSAVLRHSNVAIGKDEERYSVTQYTAGGLFQWVEHGFQSEKSFYSSLSPDELIAQQQKDEFRWIHALNHFPKPT
ncbi:hypothetical protein PQX77_020273 [Marasmius sp. AFHP31]|nr:hypothetical protein PQX77_020273 [Marasmius sp. AFHP31]